MAIMEQVSASQIVPRIQRERCMGRGHGCMSSSCMAPAHRGTGAPRGVRAGIGIRQPAAHAPAAHRRAKVWREPLPRMPARWLASRCGARGEARDLRTSAACAGNSRRTRRSAGVRCAARPAPQASPPPRRPQGARTLGLRGTARAGAVRPLRFAPRRRGARDNVGHDDRDEDGAGQRPKPHRVRSVAASSGWGACFTAGCSIIALHARLHRTHALRRDTRRSEDSVTPALPHTSCSDGAAAQN